MKIKLEYNNTIKDFEIIENVIDLTVLKHKAKELTNNEESLMLSFIDIDNEEVVLKDQHDLEYFVENLKEDSQKGLIIVKSFAESQENLESKLQNPIVMNEDEKNKESFLPFMKSQIEESKNDNQSKDNNPSTFIVQDLTVNNITRNIILPENRNTINENDGQLDVLKEVPDLNPPAIDIKTNDNFIKQVTDMIDPPKLFNIPESKLIDNKNLNLSKSYSDNTDNKHKIRNASENFDLEDYLEVNDNAGFNDTVFRSEKLDFMRDISAILPNEENTPINRIQNNYNITKNNEVMKKLINRDSQQFKLIDKNITVAQTKMSHEEKLKNQQILINNTIEQNPKVIAIETKLDALSELFLDSLSSIREEIQTTTKTFLAKQEPEIKSTFTSGVTVTHMHVTCDHCKKANFVGKRYKCLECWNYDICEKCEALNIHSHPMIRVVQVNQSQTLADLNKFYRLRKKIEVKSDDKIKEEFSKSLTKNGYANTFYEHMVKSYKNMTLEQFMVEMMKIFA